MFNQSNKKPKNIILTLIAMLLLGGIAMISSSSTTAVYAQTKPLELRVTGPATVFVGENITYELTVTNISTNTVTDITFWNDVPANTSYVSGGTFVDADPDYVSFSIASLAAGASQSVSWVAQLNSGLADKTVITNSSFNFFESTAGDAYGTLETTVMLPLDLRPIGPTYVLAGQNITYEFTVKNISNSTVTNISFYNYVPANTTYVSGGTLVDGPPDYVSFDIASVAAGASHKVSWTAQANSGLAVGTIIENDNFNFFDANTGNAFNTVKTKVEAPGTVVASYKNSNGTPFDVTVHGYQFENYTSTSPLNDDDLGASDVFELFGPVACDSGTTAADCKLTAPAQQWLTNYAIKAPAGGHCDGLAATSLRLFNSLPYNQYSTPSTFQSGATVTNDLTFPGQSVEHYIHRYFVTQNFIWSQHITGTPKVLLETLKTDFNSASPVGYTVAIFVTKNLDKFDDSDWKNGHAVAAYGIEEVSTTESRILVYDNNFPNQRQYITVNTQNDTWTYSTSATPGEDEDIYQGSAVSGNLRLVPLNLRDKPAGEYFACPFCNGETFPATANKTSGAASASSTIAGTFEIDFTGEGALMVVNDEGLRTGADHETGEFFQEIPNAELEHYMGGIAENVPPSIAVPFEEADDTFYKVFVHGTTIENPTSGSLSIHGPGFAIGVYDIQLHPEAVFEFTFSPDGDHISFDATEDLVAPEIYIAHDPIHPGNPSVIFDVEDVFLEAGEKVMVDLDPELEQIHFGHNGPEAEDFIIDMKLIYPDGGEEDHAEEIHIPAGVQTAFIDFGAWDGLLHPPTYIGGVLQNPSVNHRLKLTDAVGTYDPTPQPDAPAGVYHVEATFQNVTEIAFTDAYFTVANLGTGDVLLNADAGSFGAQVSVPADALGDDGILHMNESFTFSFDVGLADTNFADLTVDANGVPHDWIHPDPEPSYDANNASFVFDGLEALPNQLGVMALDVQALADAGQLSQRDAARLLQNLEQAEQLIADGQNDRLVIRQLQMFLARVYWNGNLAEDAKASLIAQAEFVVHQLQIERTR